MQENRIIIDWLSFTSKVHSPQNIIELLGLQEHTWETIKGACGYKDRLYFQNISIHFNGSDEMGVWCEMSGRGCRAFEQFGTGDFDSLFNLLTFEVEDMHITRLDIAYDDFNYILDMEQICEDTRSGNFVTRWKKYEVIYSNGGNTVVHGSRRSDSMLRIYDKAAEQGVDGHWVRLELQLRDDRALGFIKALKSKFYSLGELFTSVIHNYIRYIVPSDTDINRWRWKMTDYWEQFINGAEKISIWEKPGIEYSIADLESFVFAQAGNAIKTYIHIQGLDNFNKELAERVFRKNPKYENLKRRAEAYEIV